MSNHSSRQANGEPRPRRAEWTPPAGPFMVRLGGQRADARRFSTLRHTHSLPAQPTALINRERELGLIHEHVLHHEARLLTLTGPAGIGKTRLAVAAAESLLETFPDGVHFVDLAPLVDPALVPGQIAHTLGVLEMGHQPLLASLVRAVEDKRLLLVLDNFEQVLPAADHVAELLAACAELTLVVTSRVALHLRWEHELPVPPLALPAPGQTHAAEAVGQSPAVALFVQRARGVAPDFALTPENASTVAEIATRLDGLPLAIELAAARSKILSPQAILRRLEQGLSLLSGGAIDLPSRHRSLGAAIAWSYDLLSAGEQALFRHLGVLVGPFTLDEARTVHGEGSAQEELLDALSALVGHNLLARAEDLPDGEPQFQLLGTIREFALERLIESGELDLCRRRHAAFLVGLAERAEPELWGPEQAAWADRLERQLDNVRAALSWSAGVAGDPQLGLRLAGMLWRFWDLRGHLSEGRRWLAMLAGLAPAPTPERVRALNELSLLACLQGDLAAVGPPAQEALAQARELGDNFGIAFSLANLGIAAHLEGDQQRAIALLDQSLAAALEGECRIGRHVALSWRALATWAQGERELALQLQHESLALAREQGDAWSVALRLALLGEWAWLQGEVGQARRLLQESLSLRRDLEDRWGIAVCLAELGCLAHAERRDEQAVTLIAAAEAARERLGAALVPAWQSDPAEALAEARARLGEAAFEALLQAGKALPLEQAVAVALGESLSAGGVGPASERPAVSGFAQLTSREREVAQLVAQGFTNLQIAERLHISRRTADTHVSNILGKLGLAGRTQIAAWVLAQQHREGQ